MMKRAILFAATLALATPAQSQQQVHFLGDTTVDSVVIRDALRQILTVAVARENCSTLETVEAEVMPTEYQPPPASRGMATRYERWSVTMCGRVIPFLLGFWHPPEGGTMFQISYPFPEELGSERQR